jgi:hypothetical protein
MIRLRTISLILGLIVVTALLISCSASAESTAPTAAPTSTPEPATDTELSDESQVPTKLSEVPRISVEELKERLDSGEAIVIADTRSKSTFETSHIAGAISVPENEVELHLDELPLDQEIVLYCT